MYIICTHTLSNGGRFTKLAQCFFSLGSFCPDTYTRLACWNQRGRERMIRNPSIRDLFSFSDLQKSLNWNGFRFQPFPRRTNLDGEVVVSMICLSLLPLLGNDQVWQTYFFVKWYETTNANFLSLSAFLSNSHRGTPRLTISQHQDWQCW